MDGKWNKWWMAPLALIGMLWGKLRPARERRPIDAETPASRWDDMPVTAEEDEAWSELEKQQ